jgi:hypothetical protein
VSLSETHTKANNVRVPQPKQGEALLVERYSSEHLKAVILHPEDFAALQASSELLEDVAAAKGAELTELGARAHRIAESPEGELLTDEASVKRLLGL